MASNESSCWNNTLHEGPSNCTENGTVYYHMSNLVTMDMGMASTTWIIIYSIMALNFLLITITFIFLWRHHRKCDETAKARIIEIKNNRKNGDSSLLSPVQANDEENQTNAPLNPP